MFYCSQKHTPFWSPELYALRVPPIGLLMLVEPSTVGTQMDVVGPWPSWLLRTAHAGLPASDAGHGQVLAGASGCADK